MRPPNPYPRLFCFGLGYSGRALARDLLQEGWTVAGTCREAEEIQALDGPALEVFLFPGRAVSPPLLDALKQATHLLSTVPPGEDGDPVLNALEEEIAGKAWDWVGYLSTTGVYGHRQGGWVDESTPPRPDTDRGRRRLQAEAHWRRLHTGKGLPVHVFRLAAIYGPGRNSLVRVRQGRARRIQQPGLFFNRIHLEDLVQVLRASMSHPRPGAVYNVADDLPAPPGEVVSYACDLLGVAPPPWQTLAEAGVSPLAQSFYQDSKRVSNRLIKEELGVRLRYPDYRAGLKALMAGEEPAG